MDKSKSIAGIVGPTLMVMVSSEMKWWNPTLYDTQTVPLIYLNGVLLFVAGLALVKAHNIWVRGWQTLLTVIGYATMAVGLLRMYFPQKQKANFENGPVVLMVEIALIGAGFFLTLKAYFPEKTKRS